jgi:hypothetical protein
VNIYDHTANAVRNVGKNKANVTHLAPTRKSRIRNNGGPPGPPCFVCKHPTSKPNFHELTSKVHRSMYGRHEDVILPRSALNVALVRPLALGRESWRPMSSRQCWEPCAILNCDGAARLNVGLGPARRLLTRIAERTAERQLAYLKKVGLKKRHGRNARASGDSGTGNAGNPAAP